eukprot:Awhi_evm1s12208
MGIEKNSMVELYPEEYVAPIETKNTKESEKTVDISKKASDMNKTNDPNYVNVVDANLSARSFQDKDIATHKSDNVNNSDYANMTGCDAVLAIAAVDAEYANN